METVKNHSQDSFPDGLKELLDLRSLQAATGESTLDDYADALHERIREDIQASGSSIDEIAYQYLEELQPVIELGLQAVLMARNNARLGRGNLPESQQAFQAYLGDLAFNLSQAKILFLREFEDELPSSITAVLREYPKLTLVGIREQNLKTQPTKPQEAKPKPIPKSTTKPSKPKPKPKADQEAKDKEPVADTVSLSPQDILNLDPGQVQLLEEVTITIDGQAKSLKPEDVYVLAVFKQSAGSEVRLLDHNKTPLIQSITDRRGLSAPQSTFNNSIKRLQSLVDTENWPVNFEHNGQRARQSRYSLTGDPQKLGFQLPKELADSFKTPAADTAPAQVKSIAKPNGSGPESTLPDTTHDLFEGESQKWLEHLLNSEDGMPVKDLESFYEGDHRDFLSKLRLWSVRVKGQYEVDTGASSGRISIRRVGG